MRRWRIWAYIFSSTPRWLYKDKTVKILEAGCGAGRILRYYHDRGYDIIGIDLIAVAISKLKEIDPTIQAEVSDITSLRFADQSFKYVLAFGPVPQP
jgi:SAM-dependent methyltransferase